MVGYIMVRIAAIAPAILSLCSLLSDCSTGTATSDQQDDWVIVNGVLIDGTGRGPVGDAVLVIRDGRIAAVGPRGSVSLPAAFRQIDAGGATILPGFINAHVHEAFSKSTLRAWAQAGVTTVRDLCGPSDFAFRDEVAADPSCARLVAAGPMISVPGGYPAVPWGSSCFLPVNSVDDARQKVAHLLSSGADIIKIAVESGGSFGRTIPTLSLDEASAIVQATRQHGSVVSAHVLTSPDLERALLAGVDDAAHIVVDALPDTLIQSMTKHGTVWVPTIELWKNVGEGTGAAAVRNLRRFVSAGGSVALGTDYAGYNRPFQLGMPIHEIEWMLEAGMRPMQVILAATKHAAQVCNRLHDLGTLEVGKAADVLIVNGDPLQDIHTLLNVHTVIRSGQMIRSPSRKQSHAGAAPLSSLSRPEGGRP